VLTADQVDLVCGSFRPPPLRVHEKAPVPQIGGDRALLTLYSETEPLGEWRSDGHPCPCRCNAHTPSRLPLVILSLPGATPYNPLQPILRWGYLCYIA
jgi:hypothetical protein